MNKEVKKRTEQNNGNIFLWLFKNGIAIIFIITLLSIIKNNYSVDVATDGSEHYGSYKWAYEILAKSNLEQINELKMLEKSGELPKLTFEEKLKRRVGCYNYIEYMIKNTPDSAVILLPPYKVLEGKNELYYLYAPDWVEYFIYPRLCVSESMKDRQPELFKKATHVAILNGWGYENLKWELPPGERPQMAVLPIANPPSNK